MGYLQLPILPLGALQAEEASCGTWGPLDSLFQLLAQQLHLPEPGPQCLLGPRGRAWRLLSMLLAGWCGCLRLWLLSWCCMGDAGLPTLRGRLQQGGARVLHRLSIFLRR